MILFSKKFIAVLILFSVFSAIFFATFFQAESAFAQSARDEALVKGKPYTDKKPGVPEDKANTLPGGPGKTSESADEVSGLAGSIVFSATIILNIIGTFAGWIISIEAGILNWILNPDNIRLATAPIVVSGWDVTRTTVNMFFVLVLLVVAFATILRIETYSLKAILPRLIIVALLINFSLVIAGAILDFANVMTKYFYTSATRDGSDISMAIQNGLKLTSFYRTSEDMQQAGGALKKIGQAFGFISSSISIFVYALLATLFCIATIFIFLVMIVLMLIRVLYLWVLLILAPAAWFFYIIPAYKSQWEKWWSNFFRWTFFAPIAMFFIYLSITTLNNMEGHLNITNFQSAFRATIKEKNYPIKDPVASLFQFGVGMALLLGSLVTANSMSITGAGIATGLGKKMGAGMAVWAGRKAQAPTSRWAGKLGEAMDKSKLFQYAGLRQLSRPFQRYAESGRAYEKQLEERYKKQSPEYLASLYGKVDESKKRAISSALTEKNCLGLLGDQQIDEAIKLADKGGNKVLAKKLLNYDPTAANRIGKKFLDSVMGMAGATMDDVVKQLKPQDWVNMSGKAFASAPVISTAMKYGRGAHIAALGSAGELEKLKNIQNYIDTEYSDSNVINILNSLRAKRKPPLPPLPSNYQVTPSDKKIAMATKNPTMAEYIFKNAGQAGIHF